MRRRALASGAGPVLSEAHPTVNADRITMRQVAERAGVTQATVSMALANHPRISAETRSRIRALAERMGYRPNAYLSVLMRARRRRRPVPDRPVLALVSPFPTEDGWRSAPAPTVRQMREGALERAAERGYDAQEFWLHRDQMDNQRFSEILRSRGIQGVLVGPVPAGAAAPQLAWEHFASVCLSPPFANLTLMTVCNDHYFSCLRVVQECHRRGYRRPGLALLHSHQGRFHGRWEAGVLFAQRQLADVDATEPLFLGEWDDAAALAAWAERERPDVVITPGAEALLPVMLSLGWKVPATIGLAGLGLSSRRQRCAGIFQNGRLIGATGVDALIAMMERNERGLPEQARTLMVEGIWHGGDTLRAAGAGAVR
jgi:DNA-binding LacI/PurR family transcriptional regulator